MFALRLRTYLFAGVLVVLCHGWQVDLAQAQSLAGQWKGCWHSQSTGHRGRLSAKFEQNCPGYVDARFRGTFAKIIPFVYRARLRVVHQEPGLMILSGSKKLGPIMGEFRYTAEIRDGCFSATYSSRKDRGTWTLSRSF